ncbi:MAG: hypothetical protein Q8K86_05810 [Candidatus Nanopelagicaceae bacterium]|nr:hypothetical protein [Candidatus Nanopelagicaceae bacterium]
MANVLYNNARELFLTGSLDWSTDPVRAVLVGITPGDVNKYVFSAAHTALSNVTAAARVSTLGANFTTPTTTGGVAGADNITFATVTLPAGVTSVGAVVLYAYDAGTPENSLLIAYIDSATGLPVVPNGGDIIVQWDVGANKIFRL